MTIDTKRLAQAIRDSGRYVFQTADPCNDPLGFQELTPEDAAEDIAKAWKAIRSGSGRLMGMPRVPTATPVHGRRFSGRSEPSNP